MIEEYTFEYGRDKKIQFIFADNQLVQIVVDMGPNSILVTINKEDEDMARLVNRILDMVQEYMGNHEPRAIYFERSEIINLLRGEEN